MKLENPMIYKSEYGFKAHHLPIMQSMRAVKSWTNNKAINHTHVPAAVFALVLALTLTARSICERCSKVNIFLLRQCEEEVASRFRAPLP